MSYPEGPHNQYFHAVRQQKFFIKSNFGWGFPVQVFQSNPNSQWGPGGGLTGRWYTDYYWGLDSLGQYSFSTWTNDDIGRWINLTEPTGWFSIKYHEWNPVPEATKQWFGRDLMYRDTMDTYGRYRRWYATRQEVYTWYTRNGGPGNRPERPTYPQQATFPQQATHPQQASHQQQNPMLSQSAGYGHGSGSVYPSNAGASDYDDYRPRRRRKSSSCVVM